jgi:hypothetical protein
MDESQAGYMDVVREIMKFIIGEGGKALQMCSLGGVEGP